VFSRQQPTPAILGMYVTVFKCFRTKKCFRAKKMFSRQKNVFAPKKCFRAKKMFSRQKMSTNNTSACQSMYAKALYRLVYEKIAHFSQH
jgi:hypothetical protein